VLNKPKYALSTELRIFSESIQEVYPVVTLKIRQHLCAALIQQLDEP